MGTEGSDSILIEYIKERKWVIVFYSVIVLLFIILPLLSTLM